MHPEMQYVQPQPACLTALPGVIASLQPGKELREIVSLLAKDPKLSDLLVLRLDVRAQVRQGMPRLKYP